jgi:hypothetical protein
MSRQTGELYDSYGKPEFAEIPELLPGLWSGVLLHSIEKDLQDAINSLQYCH